MSDPAPDGRTAGPGRDPPGGLPAWLYVLLSLTMLSVLASALVIRTADHHRTTLLLLADTAAAIHRLSALEWQAIGSEAPGSSFWTEVDRRSAELAGFRDALQDTARLESAPLARLLHSGLRRGADEPSLDALAGLLGGYLQGTGAEFELLRQGRRGEARELNETGVDPLAARLDAWCEVLRAERGREARLAVGLAVGLGALTLLTSLGSVSLLLRRLRRNQRIVRTQETERQQEREREERDSLTGLWNRRGLHRLFARWTAEGDLSVLVLDLNRLKVINDLGGHAAGDAHLRRVSLALLDVSPPQGVVARWGGDEFVLLLPGATVAQAERLAERASALLEVPGDQMPPFAYGAAHVSGPTSLERVLALADAAMYEHKEQQRLERARLGPGAPVGLSVEEFTSRLEELETPAEILNEGLTLVCEVLGFQGSAYLERVDENFILRQVGGQLPDEAVRAMHGRIYRAGEGLSGQAILHSDSRWSNDYPSEPFALDAWVASGLKSVLMVPVRYGGRMMGLIGLLHYDSWRVITPQARRLTEAVASRLGHTFERVQAVESVRHALQGGMLALGVALEERDLETAGHTGRVVGLAEQMGARLGLSDPELDALRQGASLHDIGKLVIPDAILQKPGPLDEAEWQVMRNHAERGYEIAHRLSGLPGTTLDIIRSHHERWDGSGYPDGLAGEAIPLPARIFAVCDVYDALTHVRPYKDAWSPEAAVAEIRAQSGRHFDPGVVEAFLALLESRGQGAKQTVEARPTVAGPGRPP